MKEIDIDNHITMNYRVLTLLGMAMSLIMEQPKSDRRTWFVNAVENVVYRNKPIPEYDGEEK